MPTNNGKPWTASQTLQSPARNSRPPTLEKIGSAPAYRDYCEIRADDEPYIEKLTGWRWIAAVLALWFAGCLVLGIGVWAVYQLVLLIDWITRAAP